MGDKRKRRIAERYRDDGQYADDVSAPTKKQIKTESKTSRLAARADLARAKSEKRKWLFYLLALGLAGYFLVSTGSLTKGINLAKGLFG